MLRFVFEGLAVAAVIVGFIFEERIALFERKVLKAVKNHFNIGVDSEMEERLRIERFQKQQREREAELLELGCEPNAPKLRIIHSGGTNAA